jgi:dTMP kinase
VREFGAVTSQKTRRHPGLFITFEGIEGSGKTTQLAQAAEVLRKQGLPIVTTREPGGTSLGLQLRRLLLELPEPMDPVAEVLLMFADRKQHLVEGILPALEAGKIVLCDRYSDASRAYQGAGRGLGLDMIDLLHERFCGLDPDRTYVLDLPVPEALARIAARPGGERDRIEREGSPFHEKVRAAYRKLARQEPGRIALLDASLPPDDVFRDLIQDLDPLLERFRTGAGR